MGRTPTLMVVGWRLWAPPPADPPHAETATRAPSRPARRVEAPRRNMPPPVPHYRGELHEHESTARPPAQAAGKPWPGSRRAAAAVAPPARADLPGGRRDARRLPNRFRDPHQVALGEAEVGGGQVAGHAVGPPDGSAASASGFHAPAPRGVAAAVDDDVPEPAVRRSPIGIEAVQPLQGGGPWPPGQGPRGRLPEAAGTANRSPRSTCTAQNTSRSPAAVAPMPRGRSRPSTGARPGASPRPDLRRCPPGRRPASRRPTPESGRCGGAPTPPRRGHPGPRWPALPQAGGTIGTSR